MKKSLFDTFKGYFLSCNEDTAVAQKPVYHGVGLANFVEDYFIIGFTTTGNDPDKDYILELYCEEYHKNMPTFCFKQVLKYPENFPDDIYLSAKILPKKIPNAVDVKWTFEYLDRYIGDGVVAGPNIRRDVQFLFSYYKRYLGKEFMNSYVDFERLTMKALPQLAKHRFSDLVKHFKIKLRNVEGIAGECKTYWYCCEALKNAAKQNKTYKFIKSK